ncbi:MAG: hypothetical protein ACLUKN_16470 [Bacilli bacterium]
MRRNKECVVWYTKLGNMEGNPFKSECVLWMVIATCNWAQMSAEVIIFYESRAL